MESTLAYLVFLVAIIMSTIIATSMPGVDVETTEEHVVMAVGNSDGGTAAILKVVQGNSKMLLTCEQEESEISSYCGDHQTRCRDLLVLENAMQYIAIVPLESGVWVVDVRYNGSDMFCHNTYTSQRYDSPCRTLGVFSVSGEIILLCTRTSNILYSCSLRLDKMQVNESYLSCGRNPVSLGQLPHSNLSFISNILTVGVRFDQIRLYFYVERSLYSIRIEAESFTSHNEFFLPENCDYVKSLLKDPSDNNSVIVYCNNNHVYRLNFRDESLPSLLGNGSLYYSCHEGSYRLDRQAERVFYGGTEVSINLPTSAYYSGVCFGGNKLVYEDRIEGAYVLTPPSQSFVRLNTAGCVHGSCEIPLVFSERYILLRSPIHITLIDGYDNSKIIDTDDVPTTLVTLIPIQVSTTLLQSSSPSPTLPAPSPSPPAPSPTPPAPSPSPTSPAPSRSQHLLVPIPAVVVIVVIIGVCIAAGVVCYCKKKSKRQRKKSLVLSNMNGSTANGSTTNGSTTNESTANESTANESTANGSIANGSTTNESTVSGTNESTANGSTANESTANESTVSGTNESTANGSTVSGTNESRIMTSEGISTSGEDVVEPIQNQSHNGDGSVISGMELPVHRNNLSPDSVGKVISDRNDQNKNDRDKDLMKQQAVSRQL